MKDKILKLGPHSGPQADVSLPLRQKSDVAIWLESWVFPILPLAAAQTFLYTVRNSPFLLILKNKKYFND